jgi:uncharacterized protein
MRALVSPRVDTRLRPIDAACVHVTGGFWGERLTTNRERSIPHGLAQLEASGALGNFRHAARGSGRYVGGLDDAGITFPFLDSDVYKWLEAVGWELGRAPDDAMATSAGEVIGLVEAAQRADGYLNTFVQLSGREAYTDLQWGHELYCIGHLTQAAVAWQRAVGDGRLVAVAAKAIGHIERALGEDGRAGIDGHPEIEMALVELYRTTGEERYLRLAALQVERRGRGLMGAGRMGPRYWQDHAPVREAPTMTGHAVRQLYLDSGVVDVATETGDDELLGAVIRRWEDMWASRTYLTGALGSRHRDEAFGDAFELPSDRAYAETCAAIASVMLGWRLLLATGEARFADAIERTLFNAVLPGVGFDGASFYYTNPLHLRERAELTGRTVGSRQPWYSCACCPPNIMRTLSSFEHLLATTDGEGATLSIAQLAASTIEATLDGGPVELRVETAYPADGRVGLEVARTPERPWTLRLRVPAWADGASVRVEGDDPSATTASPGWHAVERRWSAGDRLELVLPMRPRLTIADRRIDAVRESVAIERGPLVYCVEQVDLPAGTSIESIAVPPDAAALEVVEAPAGAGSLPAVRTPARVGPMPSAAPGAWPYRDASYADPVTPMQSTELTAVAYLAWANRTPGGMRVWLPLDRPDQV